MQNDIEAFLAAQAGLKTLEDSEKESFSGYSPREIGGVIYTSDPHHQFAKATPEARHLYHQAVITGEAVMRSAGFARQRLAGATGRSTASAADIEIRDSIGKYLVYAKSAVEIEANHNPSKRPEVASDKPMNDSSRDELKILFASLEERMEKRAERLERAETMRARAYRGEQEARDKLYAERFEATNRRLEDRDKIIDSKLDGMSATISKVNETVGGFAQHLDEKVKEVKSSNRNTLLGILAIGAATVVGLWGANSTIVGSASSIFDSGARQAEQQRESQELLRETRELLKQIRLQAAPPPERPAPPQQ